MRACQAGHRVVFATAAEWVARLAEAHHAGRIQHELARLGRYAPLVIDEDGYIPFEPEAANLFFQLVWGKAQTPPGMLAETALVGHYRRLSSTDGQLRPRPVR